VAGIHILVCKNAHEPLFLRLALSFFLIVFGSDHVLLNSGILRNSVADDPQLGGKRNELINLAAGKLAETKMITFENQHGRFHITDLGRIAAKYYIRYSSMEIFAKEFRPKMSEADVLAMLCKSTEASLGSFHYVVRLTLIISLIKSKYVSRRFKNLSIS
jgi:replicative superfamily II helicase